MLFGCRGRGRDCRDSGGEGPSDPHDLRPHGAQERLKTHEFGADAMIENLEKLGYKEMILRCDGKLALKAVQEEVKARRHYQTPMENSPVGDRRVLSKQLRSRWEGQTRAGNAAGHED